MLEEMHYMHYIVATASVPYDGRKLNQTDDTFAHLLPAETSWKGSRLAEPSRAATFHLSLLATQVQGRHENTFYVSLTKKHSRESFGRQKVCLSPLCIILWKILHGTTHDYFFNSLTTVELYINVDI